MPEAATRKPPERVLHLRFVLTSIALAVAAMGGAVLIKSLLLSATGANAGFIVYVPAIALALNTKKPSKPKRNILVVGYQGDDLTNQYVQADVLERPQSRKGL